MPSGIVEETRARILAAAECIFAEHGYEAASLRMITQAAGVNLAAINYHFDEKQSLYCQILGRRLKALNQSRLTRLEDAERTAGDQPAPMPMILEALAAPLYQLGQDAAAGGPSAVRLIGRSLTEPQPFMASLLADEFHHTMARFAQAMRRHLPARPPAEFLWRLSFVVGAMHHAAATIHQMGALTHGICRNDDHAVALRHFLQFAEAALLPPRAAANPDH